MFFTKLRPTRAIKGERSSIPVLGKIFFTEAKIGSVMSLINIVNLLCAFVPIHDSKTRTMMAKLNISKKIFIKVINKCIIFRKNLLTRRNILQKKSKEPLKNYV